MQCLSAAHAFDYIALRINTGLSSCKELATVMDISLDNNLVPVTLAIYMFSHIDACLG